MTRRPAPWLLLAAIAWTACAPTAPPSVPLYTVDRYDPARDPAVDLEATIEIAREAGRHIILEVGGDWCGWWKILDAFIHDTPAVKQALERGFVIMKVNMGPENENQEFLGRYPAIVGYPHLFVLDGDGNLLESRNTGGFEQGRGYDATRFLAFLEEFAP